MNILNHQEGEDYQSIFESAIEGIFQSSFDGHFLKVNPAMAHIYGYDSPEDMLTCIKNIGNQIYVKVEEREYFLKELQDKGSVDNFEGQNHRKDGSIIWTLTNARIVRDAEGNALFIEGFITDITSRKDTELALRASEERYRALVERLPGAVFFDAPDDSEKTLFISSKIEDLVGYTPNEWITGVSWSKSIHPQDRKRILAVDKQTDQTGEPFREEYRFRRKDGEYIWIREDTSLVRDDHGEPLFWQGFLIDISYQKQVESAIKQSEEQFKKIFQANPIASCIATLKEGKFLAANESYFKISDFKPDDFIGHTSTELGFITTTRRKKLVARLKKEKSLRNEKGEFITKSGEIRNTLEFFDLIRFDGQDCILAMFYDMTEQVKSQAALMESEEKYRQLFEAESDAIFLIDNESGNILEVNAAATVMYGYSKEELVHKKNSDLSAEPEKTRKITKDTPINKEKVISVPIRYHRKKDGTIFPVEITGRFFEWRGRPVHIAAIRDITERKKVEQALKTSEERFRLAFQTSPDAININRLKDGLFIDINEGFTSITGYTREEVIGKTSQEINIWENLAERDKLIDELIKNGLVNNQESKFRMKDGRIITALMSARIITLDGALHIISITRNIETIKQSEAMLQRQLKELTILHNIALAASSTKSVDELLKRTTDTIFDALSPDNCGVELVTDGGDMYVAHSSYRGASKNGIKRLTPLSKGISGKVISTGKPVRLGDISQDADYVEVTQGIQSELCVPIKIQDRVIGAFNIESKQVHAYSESDERLLNTIAGTLATAIEQLRLMETSQHHLQELTILNSVSLASTRASSLDELIEQITQIIGESLYPDNFGVLLLDKTGTTLIPHPSYRGISSEKIPTRLSLDQGISGQVAASGTPLRIANVRTQKKYIEVTPQVRSELCVPIKLADRVLGVINAESVIINAFSEDDEQLLSTIAGTLATAIEKLRLLEEEKKRRQEAEILLEATTTLTTFLNLDSLYNSILEALSKIITYDSASIAIKDDDKLVIVAGRGFPAGYNVIGKQLVYSEKWFHVGNSHQVQIIPDVHLEPRFEQWVGSEYIRGWMGVPMVVHSKLIGFINLDSCKVNAFTEKDAIVAQTFANSAAVAIENARLFEAEQESREKAEALREATAVLTTSIELESLYDIILDSATKLVPFDSASIEILDQGYLEVVAGRGLKENKICVGKRYAYDVKKWEEPGTRKEPILIPNVQIDDRFEKLEGTEYIRGWMGVPMIVHERLIGFLNFDSSTEDFFTNEHAHLAQTFGNQAAVAIENARLFQEQRQRNQIIAAMANIANEFSTAQELTPALDKITQHALGLLNASTVAIYLLQDDNKTIKVVTAQGTYHEQLTSHSIQIGTGITGNIIATGKPEIVDDMTNDSRRVRVPGTPEDDAQRDTIMSAPLILRGKTIGAINAWRKRSRGLFNESELNFLVSIAHQASMSIESIRLFQETARRAQEAHAIAEVGRDVSSTLQLDIVLDRIAQYAMDLLRAETSAVYLLNSEGTLLRAIAALGKEAEEIKNDPLSVGKGILGNIALQKSGEIVNDTQSDHRAIVVKGTVMEPDEHLMGVPVLSKNRLTGLVAVWRTGADEKFKPHELDFLTNLAQQAAVTIENARLFEAEQRHFQEAETLRQAAEAITSTLDINQVLDSILENLNRVLPFDSASVFLIENDRVRLTAYKGLPVDDFVIDQLFPADNALFLEIWQTGRPLILKDAQKDSRYEKWVVDYTRGWMGVPLIARGKIIGYITIDSLKVEAYEEHDANLAITFAHQAAVAIENARLYERGEVQIRQLTVLREIDSAISSSFDLRVTLNLLVGYAAKELNADAVTVLLYNPDLKSLSLYTSTGFSNKHNDSWSDIRIGEGLAGHVVLQRKLVHITNLNNSTEFQLNAYNSDENFISYFGIPLIGKGQIKGVMELYTRKEINPDPDWLNFLHTLAGQAAIAIDNVQLFKNLQRSNQELILAYDTTLAGWGRALELRDKETQGHTDRVVELTIELARRLGIDGEELTHIMRGALLHDIGKMGIPDHILHKPGPLTEEEWEIMRQHPQYAYNLMYPIPYLRPALDIPYAHHERWDGSGYPRGLKGEDIPLPARIFAVVDIWDALLNERIYREAWPGKKVLEYLKNAAGIELDPDIVENFLDMIQEDDYKNQTE